MGGGEDRYRGFAYSTHGGESSEARGGCADGPMSSDRFLSVSVDSGMTDPRVATACGRGDISRLQRMRICWAKSLEKKVKVNDFIVFRFGVD